MTEETVETKPCILPYTYHKLPEDRVMIIGPNGLRLIYNRSHVERILQGDEYPLRDLSSHERIMWETALTVLNEKSVYDLPTRF